VPFASESFSSDFSTNQFGAIEYKKDFFFIFLSKFQKMAPSLLDIAPAAMTVAKCLAKKPAGSAKKPAKDKKKPAKDIKKPAASAKSVRGIFAIRANKITAAVAMKAENMKYTIDQAAKTGRDVNACNNIGETMLHQCHNEHSTRVLISIGADVNAQDHYGRTPLHVACTPAIVKELVLAGADPYSMDTGGQTPFDYHENDMEIIHILLTETYAFEAFKLSPPPGGSSLFSAAIYSPAFDRMRTFAVRSAESRRAVDLTSRMYDDMFATYRSKPANCISDVYCQILLDHSLVICFE
jgi:hypothetical protein